MNSDDYGYCAWCGWWFNRATGEKVKSQDAAITHGICGECAAKVIEESKRINMNKEHYVNEA